MAERAGCRLVKLHHGIVGFPDRLLLRPDGSHALIEFKRRGEGPTLIQEHWHRVLARMKHPVTIVHSLAQFDRVLTPSTRGVGYPHGSRGGGPRRASK